MPEQEIERLAEIIKNSKNTVFFGGAGVSTESGIPDFRSEKGLYRARQVYGYPPEELISHTLFMREPALFFRYYKENLIAAEAKPNAAHTALAELEAKGLLAAVITQNIDGLHQLAGSKNVLELHGSNLRQYCLRCGERYDLAYILEPANCEGFIPKCKICGGTVRPEVVPYEEGLNQSVMAASIKAISAAEVLIVGGTSLAVYPAAGLVRYFSGGNLIVVNQSETPQDRFAGLVLHEKIGEVFAAVMQLL
jgi:NAD-dependent deacetylase